MQLPALNGWAADHEQAATPLLRAGLNAGFIQRVAPYTNSTPGPALNREHQDEETKTVSIRIEVTGDSLPEIADKLLALASQFSKQAVPFDPPAAPVEDKPRQTRKSKSPDKAPAAEAEQTDAGNAETAATEQAHAEPAAQTASTPDAPSETPALDFDKDVAPVVIEAVQKAGRDGVSAILSEFGAERASEVDPAQWPELVERLKAL